MQAKFCFRKYGVWDSLKSILNFNLIESNSIYRQVFSITFHTAKWNMWGNNILVPYLWEAIWSYLLASLFLQQLEFHDKILAAVLHLKYDIGIVVW